MAELLVDTDIFIDHIRGTRTIRPKRHRLYYSVVTRAELFAGGAEHGVRQALELYGELPIDRVVAERGGRIRRETGVELADALIAGTALEHGFTLITRNVKHFERVRGLRVRSAI